MTPPDHLPSVGPWRDLRRLGTGGFGVVYRARDDLGRDAVVKFPLDGGDPEQLLRFEREVAVHARLAGVPGMVPFLGSGASPQGPWMALSWMAGGTLEDRLHREGRLEPAEALSVIRELADALAEAHGYGLVHRDLKPANVLFDGRGRPAISDFGLARAGPNIHVSLSTTGESLATQGYAPPEQITDFTGTGPPADVFALGVILHEMIYGHRPFRGATTVAVMAAIQSGREPRPDEAPALTELFERCFAPRPEDRFQDAGELATALRELEPEDLEPQASSSLGIALVSLLGVAVCGLMLALWLLWPGGPRRTEPDPDGPGESTAGNTAADTPSGETPGEDTSGEDPTRPERGKDLDPGTMAQDGKSDASGGSKAPVFEPIKRPASARLSVVSEHGGWRLRRHVLPLAVHSGLVMAAARSPDGALILSVDITGRRCLADARTGELVQRRWSRGRKYRSCAWAGEGRWMVLGCEDGTVEFEPRATADGEVRSMTLPARPRDLVGLPGAAPRCLAATDEGVVLLDLRSGTARPLEGMKSSKRLALASGGELAVAINDEAAVIFDLQAGTARPLRLSPADHANESCAISPDGRELALGRLLKDGRGEIELVALADGAVRRRWLVAPSGTDLGPVMTLEYLPGGDLLSSGATGVIVRWSLAAAPPGSDGAPEHRELASVGAWVRALEFEPETRQVFSVGNSCVVRRDLVDGELARSASRPPRPAGLQYEFRVGSASERPPELLLIPSVGYATFVTPDGERDEAPSLFVQQKGDCHFVYDPAGDRLLSVAAGTIINDPVRRPKLPVRYLDADDWQALTYSPGKNTLYLLAKAGGLTGVELGEGKTTLQREVESSEVIGLFPTSFRAVDVAFADGRVTRLKSGRTQIAIYPAIRDRRFELVALTPDALHVAQAGGRALVVRSRSGRVKLLDISGTQRLQRLRLSDDGRFVLFVTASGLAVVFDVDRDETTKFHLNTGRIDDAMFFPGTHTLALVTDLPELFVFDSTAKPAGRKQIKRKRRFKAGRPRPGRR